MSLSYACCIKPYHDKHEFNHVRDVEIYDILLKEIIILHKMEK